MFAAHWGRTNASELQILLTEYSRFALTTNVFTFKSSAMLLLIVW